MNTYEPVLRAAQDRAGITPVQNRISAQDARLHVREWPTDRSAYQSAYQSTLTHSCPRCGAWHAIVGEVCDRCEADLASSPGAFLHGRLFLVPVAGVALCLLVVYGGPVLLRGLVVVWESVCRVGGGF